MASVTISDLDAILKEFYLGPIIESLNSQLEMVQLFTKATLDWQGRQVVIPVHVSRNDGTGFRAESGQLPVAGGQGYVNLNIKAKYLYGRFSLTGPAIATAKTTANSFATYVQSEMDGLVTDTKLKANQGMFTGGGCVGYVRHLAVQPAAPAAGSTLVADFCGNKDVLRTLQGIAEDPLTLPPGAPGNLLNIDIISMGTYESLLHNNAFPRVDSTYLTCDGNVGLDNSITLVTDTGGTVQWQLLSGTRHPAMVVVKGTGAVAGGGAFVPNAAGLDPVAIEVGNEALGVYANLGLSSHFTVDRSIIRNVAAPTGGTSVNPSLRSTVESVNIAAVAGNAALTFGRMQTILDEIMVLGGDDPDCMYVHPGIRQKYADLLTFTQPGAIQKAAVGGVGTGDPGFSGYAFNGIPMKMSRHCGKGLIVFLKTKSWSIAELQSFGMADLDGNVLSRLSGQDEWEGFVRWYYNLVCKEPNRNAILTNVTFPV
jgi:hypothetical protein